MRSARSTTYRVELTERAEQDLVELYESINAQESPTASLWYNALEALILSLDHSPLRGKQTMESPALRQLLHGKKPHIYRVIYRIDLDASIIYVLHIRHGARNAAAPDELLSVG